MSRGHRCDSDDRRRHGPVRRLRQRDERAAGECGGTPPRNRHAAGDGASRGRILRQLLTESLLLGLISSLFGLGVAKVALPFFAALIQLPPGLDVSPDPWIYGSLGILTFAVGISPASRPPDTGSARISRARSRPIRSARRCRCRGLGCVPPARDPGRGFDHPAGPRRPVQPLVDRSHSLTAGHEVDSLMTVAVGSPTNGAAWDSARRDAYWTALLDQVRLIWGVAAAASLLPPLAE